MGRPSPAAPEDTMFLPYPRFWVRGIDKPFSPRLIYGHREQPKRSSAREGLGHVEARRSRGLGQKMGGLT